MTDSTRLHVVHVWCVCV